MVWAFCVGLVVGLPAGCYLREKGYAKRMRHAYHAMLPDDKGLSTDNLDKLLPNQKREKFYRDVEKGLVRPEDFERYIYGGTHDRKFYHDERDLQED